MRSSNQRKTRRRAIALCILLGLLTFHAIAQSQTSSATTNDVSVRKKSSSKTSSAGGASDSDIAAAKTSGKVWVNTDTGVYHKNGRWYGKTKIGKFMTENEAKASGYKEAKK